MKNPDKSGLYFCYLQVDDTYCNMGINKVKDVIYYNADDDQWDIGTSRYYGSSIGQTITVEGWIKE